MEDFSGARTGISDLSEEKLMQIFQAIKNFFSEMNFMAPIFISDLLVRRLKKGTSREALNTELSVYLEDNVCESTIDWLFDMVDDVIHERKINIIEFTNEISDEMDAEDNIHDVQLQSTTPIILDDSDVNSGTVENENRKRELPQPSNRRFKRLKSDSHGPCMKCIEYAVALQEYRSSRDGILNFNKGDLFRVIYDAEELNGWSIALNDDNKEGLIPANFVRIVSLDELREIRNSQLCLNNNHFIHDNNSETSIENPINTNQTLSFDPIQSNLLHLTSLEPTILTTIINNTINSCPSINNNEGDKYGLKVRLNDSNNCHPEIIIFESIEKISSEEKENENSKRKDISENNYLPNLRNEYEKNQLEGQFDSHQICRPHDISLESLTLMNNTEIMQDNRTEHINEIESIIQTTETIITPTPIIITSTTPTISMTPTFEITQIPMTSGTTQINTTTSTVPTSITPTPETTQTSTTSINSTVLSSTTTPAIITITPTTVASITTMTQISLKNLNLNTLTTPLPITPTSETTYMSTKTINSIGLLSTPTPAIITQTTSTRNITTSSSLKTVASSEKTTSLQRAEKISLETTIPIITSPDKWITNSPNPSFSMSPIDNSTSESGITKSNHTSHHVKEFHDTKLEAIERNSNPNVHWESVPYRVQHKLDSFLLGTLLKRPTTEPVQDISEQQKKKIRKIEERETMVTLFGSPEMKNFVATKKVEQPCTSKITNYKSPFLKEQLENISKGSGLTTEKLLFLERLDATFEFDKKVDEIINIPSVSNFITPPSTNSFTSPQNIQSTIQPRPQRSKTKLRDK